MNYPLYIIFGFAPSIVWLLFFLRKDQHPESNSMILKVFFFGMLAALPVALLEIGFYEQIKALNFPIFLSRIFYVFLGIAFIEEVFKYLVVKTWVKKNAELDEPVDVMLFMIIAALGFAASENLLILFPLLDPFQFFETAVVSMFRFVGATLLHTLTSGLIGYFLVLSFLESKNHSQFAKGLFTATALHGLYNFSIMEVGGSFKFLIPIAILLSLAVFISLGFKRVKKMASICLPAIKNK